MREAEFQEWLRQLAGVTNWLCYHTHQSKHSPSGFPDTVLVKQDGKGAARMIFAELKIGKREPTTEQVKWLMAVQRVPGVESYCWYPHQRDEIEAKLKGAA